MFSFCFSYKIMVRYEPLFYKSGCSPLTSSKAISSLVFPLLWHQQWLFSPAKVQNNTWEDSIMLLIFALTTSCIEVQMLIADIPKSKQQYTLSHSAWCVLSERQVLSYVSEVQQIFTGISNVLNWHKQHPINPFIQTRHLIFHRVTIQKKLPKGYRMNSIEWFPANKNLEKCKKIKKNSPTNNCQSAWLG